MKIIIHIDDEKMNYSTLINDKEIFDTLKTMLSFEEALKRNGKMHGRKASIDDINYQTIYWLLEQIENFENIEIEE